MLITATFLRLVTTAAVTGGRADHHERSSRAQVAEHVRAIDMGPRMFVKNSVYVEDFVRAELGLVSSAAAYGSRLLRYPS